MGNLVDSFWEVFLVGDDGERWHVLPTASHPGRRVGSKQSVSTTRAALYISRKEATSVSSYAPGPRPGNGARDPNQLSIMMERLQESFKQCSVSQMSRPPFVARSESSRVEKER